MKGSTQIISTAASICSIVGFVFTIIPIIISFFTNTYGITNKMIDELMLDDIDSRILTQLSILKNKKFDSEEKLYCDLNKVLKGIPDINFNQSIKIISKAIEPKGFNYYLQKYIVLLYFINLTSGLVLVFFLIKPKSKKGRLNPGAILYANIVQYSALSITGQDQKAGYLKEWSNQLPMGNRLKSHLKHRYWVKFGGGDLLIYIQNLNNQESEFVVMKRAFLLSLNLLEFISCKNCQLGITIHWSGGCNYQACGSLVELWGNELDKVRRIMSFSDGGHFFISEAAFSHLDRDLFRNKTKSGNKICGPLLPIIEKEKKILEEISKSLTLLLEGEDLTYHLDSIKIYDRHYKIYPFFNYYVKNAANKVCLGNSIKPPDYVKIEHRDRRNATDPNQCFVRHLVDSNEVCIVALTHEKTRDYLETALKERKGKFWDKLDIIFPSEKFLNQWVEADKDSETRLNNWKEGKRTVLQFLEAVAADHVTQWNCWETESNLTFWGNRLLKGNEEIIRLAPLMPGPDLKNLRYVTFHRGIDGYQECSDAFQIMMAGSISISEWNLIGNCFNNEFTYTAVAKKSRLKDFGPSFYTPVALVIVYMEDTPRGGMKLLLQHRTIYNSTDHYGGYSNISGRVTVSDILNDPKQISQYYMKISNKLKSQIELDCSTETDFATKAFNNVSGWQNGKSIQKEIWERAVVREIREELGLEIIPARIQHFICYPLNNNSSGINLYFKIHAFQITREEFLVIRSKRPRCELKEFNMNELRAHWGNRKLNQFLQLHYKDVFEPILQNKLKIQ